MCVLSKTKSKGTSRTSIDLSSSHCFLPQRFITRSYLFILVLECRVSACLCEISVDLLILAENYTTRKSTIRGFETHVHVLHAYAIYYRNERVIEERQVKYRK